MEYFDEDKKSEEVEIFSSEESEYSYGGDSSDELDGSDLSDDDEFTTSQNDQQSEDDQWTDLEVEPEIFDFNGKEQIQCEIGSNTKPKDIFSLFFDDELMNKITDWINLRAFTLIQSGKLYTKSNILKWEPIGVFEFKQFLGLSILAGYLKDPPLAHYWNDDPMYHDTVWSKAMSHDKFDLILRCLCFYNVPTNPTSKDDRICKIRNFIDHIKVNTQKVYHPPQKLSLDEPMRIWKDSLYFRHYAPRKRLKYNMKFYELCTFDGFILDFILSRQENNEFDVTVELLRDYVDKGHIIYMDKYYANIDLAKYLWNRRTHLCGTLKRSTNGIPKIIINKKLKINERVWRSKDNITVLKWRDGIMISSLHNGEMIEVINKRGAKKHEPKMVVDYLLNMSGINRVEKMIPHYSLPQGTVRWYVKAFFYILDMVIWNSCWLSNKCNEEKKISYRKFREKLALELINLPKETDEKQSEDKENEYSFKDPVSDQQQAQ